MVMLAVSGHYVFAELSGVSERVLVTLPRAGYACGLTFSYLLTGGGGVSAMLRTASGRVLWSSPPAASAVWEAVGLPDSRYLTPPH